MTTSYPQEPELKFGAVIDATIKEVRDYGFIVELAPGVATLLHVSQISHKFVRWLRHVSLCLVLPLTSHLLMSLPHPSHLPPS